MGRDSSWCLGTDGAAGKGSDIDAAFRQMDSLKSAPAVVGLDAYVCLR